MAVDGKLGILPVVPGDDIGNLTPLQKLIGFFGAGGAYEQQTLRPLADQYARPDSTLPARYCHE